MGEREQKEGKFFPLPGSRMNEKVLSWMEMEVLAVMKLRRNFLRRIMWVCLRMHVCGLE